MLTFGAVTAPLAADEFLARHWGRRAAHLRDPRRAFEAHFGWPALNALLNSGDLTYPSTVVSFEERVVPAEEFTKGSDGKTIDAAAVLRLFREGASFSIRGADSHWPPLKAIISCLYDTFFESVHTNIYCSPANTQGFRCHYDLHEVFVLQVEGTKHWRVFEPTIEAPVEPWKSEDVPDDPSAAYVDVRLQKGDVLYVPRGHWHYATAEDSDSLHITVGITCRRGDALLDWLAPELRRFPAWRRNVPLMGGPTPTGELPLTPEFEAWVDELRSTLRATLDDPQLARRFATEVYAGTTPMPTVEMPFDGTAGPLPIDQLLFSRPPGQRHVITEETPGQVIVRVAGSQIELEGVSRELLARLFSPVAFSVDDLGPVVAGVSREELSELLETLVRGGLLQARIRAAV